jgi:hypothetical protein
MDLKKINRLLVILIVVIGFSLVSADELKVVECDIMNSSGEVVLLDLGNGEEAVEMQDGLGIGVTLSPGTVVSVGLDPEDMEVLCVIGEDGESARIVEFSSDESGFVITEEIIITD